MEIRTMSEIMEEGWIYADWGGWTLDPEYPSLDLGPNGARYYIDLRRCLTSAEVLDWICQVAKKVWASDTILVGLVRALDDVLHPQGNLCSFGASKVFTEETLRARVDKFVAEAKSYPRS